MDSNPDTVTFKTDRFSTYALIYTDNPQKDDNFSTGDSSDIQLLMIIAAAAVFGFAVLYFTTGKYGMTEEKKDRIVKSLIKWGKKSKWRRAPALAAVLLVLLYFYSIGEKPVLQYEK